LGGGGSVLAGQALFIGGMHFAMMASAADSNSKHNPCRFATPAVFAGKPHEY
jgi:hypothetical protein